MSHGGLKMKLASLDYRRFPSIFSTVGPPLAIYDAGLLELAVYIK